MLKSKSYRAALLLLAVWMVVSNCKEEVFLQESEHTPYKIIHTGHNFDKDGNGLSLIVNLVKLDDGFVFGELYGDSQWNVAITNLNANGNLSGKFSLNGFKLPYYSSPPHNVSFLNTQTDECWILTRTPGSSGNNTNLYALGLHQSITISAPDSADCNLCNPFNTASVLGLKINKANPFLVSNNSGFGKYQNSLWKTTDGGAIVAGEMDNSAIKLSKFNSNLSLAFEAQYNPCTYSANCSPPDGFVELGGRYFFAYNGGSGGQEGLLEFDLNGIRKVAEFNLDGRLHSLAPLGDTFVVLSSEGSVSTFDQNFTPLGNVDFPPLPAIRDPSSEYYSQNYSSTILTWYPATDKLYFVSSPIVKSSSGEVHSSTLFVGGMDISKNVAFKIHDFGFPIIQHQSAFNPDGSAAHVVLLQTTEKTTDLLFFKTDAEFNAVK